MSGTNTRSGIGPHAYIYIVLVGICSLCSWESVFHACGIYKVRKARSTRTTGTLEESDRYSLRQSDGVRDEDEKKQVTDRNTNTITNGGRSDSLLDLIVDLPL